MSTSAPPPLAASPPPPPRRCHRWIGLLPGLVIVVLGLGFLLDNLGVLHFRAECFWGLILAAVGIIRIVRGKFHDWFLGTLLILVGAGLTLDCLHVLPFAVWRLWPLFLIALGISWLIAGSVHPVRSGPFSDWASWHSELHAWRNEVRAWRAQRRAWRSHWRAYTSSTAQPWWAPSSDPTRPWWAPPASAAAPAAAGPFHAATPDSAPEQWFEMKAVFAGLNRRVHFPGFHGAALYSFFGGCNLDLRALVPTASTVIIEAHAVFGAVEVYIPANWVVSVQATGLFGACEDQTRPSAIPNNAATRLIVRGEAVFGGIVVKN